MRPGALRHAGDRAGSAGPPSLYCQTAARYLCHAGRIGPETDRREQALREQTGLDPEIEWSDTGRIQLNEEVTVTLTHEIDLGLFAGFGSFPITLRADATGKSEVYWK